MSWPTHWRQRTHRAMLVEFQQALADLVASPELCRRVRADPVLLHSRYDLTKRESDRLIGMVHQRGMALNCMLYRANRLAPLALNLYEFCRALGPRLGPLLTEYTEQCPNTNVHFYMECERFCAFIEGKLKEVYELEPIARAVFAKERLAVRLNLGATQTVL
jgi:hypothetical protein